MPAGSWWVFYHQRFGEGAYCSGEDGHEHWYVHSYTGFFYFSISSLNDLFVLKFQTDLPDTNHNGMFMLLYVFFLRISGNW